MNNKLKRLALIVVMVAIFVYTVINYTRGNLSQGTMVLFMALMVWLLIGQISALIREWKED